ncbi:unnamed protein product [Sphenostylis stenocarpa]|uniref:Uncharacterized protein n=1 Tax=Sphenostylis stenocarpa TaxID=92480 RepID=A0AA86VYW4_9FABA|nr:unnamed protein product [Sphenostylis stenocarpa]
MLQGLGMPHQDEAVALGVRREVPYLLDRVHCLACTYLSQDWLGVQCQKNTGFQIIPAPRSISSTSESLIEKARTKGA